MGSKNRGRVRVQSRRKWVDGLRVVGGGGGWADGGTVFSGAVVWLDNCSRDFI